MQIKQLFVTTGLLSLLNALTILGASSKKADAWLIIGSEDDHFSDINRQIANIYPFQKIINMPSIYALDEIGDDIPLEEIDECYLISHYSIENRSRRLKKARFIWIEEGLSSYMRYDLKANKANEAQFLLLHDRFDFINDAVPVKKLDRSYFKKLALSIAEKKPVHTGFAEQDKVILLLAQYLLPMMWGEENALLFYRNLVESLIFLGYKIIFKTHPRIRNQRHLIDNLLKPESVYFLDNDLPAEVLQLDVVAVVSASSGALVTLSDLYEIPAFSITENIISSKKISDEDKFYAEIVREYIPDISKLLAVGNVSKMEKQACKKTLQNIFDLFMQGKPTLSENQILRKKAKNLVHPIKYQKSLNWADVPKFSQIRLETTNLCGYNCFMCPRTKMTRPAGVMSMADLSHVLDMLDDIRYECDFHMHGYGEALLCDDLPERIKLVTSRKPNFIPYIYTTLGYEKEPEWLESLFANGLKKILVSLYGYSDETYQSVHGINRFEQVRKNIRVIAQLKWKYPFRLKVQLDGFDEHYPHDMPQAERQELKAAFKRELIGLGIPSEQIGEQTLHNFGDGLTGYPVYERDVPCSICWGWRRSHLNILWNLDIIPCAYDYNAGFIWGNLKKNTLTEIYNSSERLTFLEKLLDKQSQLIMCQGCYPYAYANEYEQEYEKIKAYAHYHDRSSKL